LHRPLDPKLLLSRAWPRFGPSFVWPDSRLVGMVPSPLQVIRGRYPLPQWCRQRHRGVFGGPKLSFPWPPCPEWFFHSLPSPAIYSRLLSCVVPFHHPSTASLLLPLLRGKSQRPPFPIDGGCTCCWNNSPSSWVLDAPFWLLFDKVLLGPSPLLGSLPFLVPKRGRGRHWVASSSLWLVGTSLTLLFRLGGFDTHGRRNPSHSWRHVAPPFLMSQSSLG